MPADAVKGSANTISYIINRGDDILNNLISEAKNGNSNAFMALVENIKAQLYKTAFMQLRNEQDALDAVREALVKAFAGIRDLKQDEFFKTWLIRILINECRRIQNCRGKVMPMEKECDQPEGAHIDENVGSMDMADMLEKLEAMYIEIIDLRYNHDMKMEEILKALDIPAGIVKSRLNTAHKILRKEYAEGREEF